MPVKALTFVLESLSSTIYDAFVNAAVGALPARSGGDGVHIAGLRWKC
jgi:hypothetical protein